MGTVRMICNDEIRGNDLFKQAREWLTCRQQIIAGELAEPANVTKAVEGALGPWASILHVPLQVTSNSSSFRFCFLCLRNDVPPDEMTGAHIWNQDERRQRPLPGADWYDERFDAVGFVTNLTLSDGPVTISMGIGGRVEAFIGTRLPICKGCQEVEAAPDGESHELKRFLRDGHDSMTIQGLEPGSAIRAGGRLTAELDQPVTSAIEARRTYFLNVMNAAVVTARGEGTGRGPVSTRELASLVRESGPRARTLTALKDRRPRVRIFDTEGTERFAERVLTWIPTERRTESQVRRLLAKCGEAEELLKETDSATDGKARRAQLMCMTEIMWMAEPIAAKKKQWKKALGLAGIRHDLKSRTREVDKPGKACQNALVRTISIARQGAQEVLDEIEPTRELARVIEETDEKGTSTETGKPRHASIFEPWESEGQKARVLEVLEGNDVARADIFGSATSAAGLRRESDLDFAIWWKKTSNGHAEKKNLRLQLEKACGRNVDIVVSPENSTNPLFMEGWKKTRIRIFPDENE